jgi:6-phosphofructokinase 1
MKKIAVLTSGGDAPGMNAAIRAVVRVAIYHGHEVYGVNKGYSGLLEADMQKMDVSSVGDIIHRGGTKLRTARCPEFKTPEGIERAVEVLKMFKIDGLVVIGGDGSLTGAMKLCEAGIPTIGVPATIDNDLGYTDYTIGFNTALTTVVNAIGNVRDTSTSHGRANIIEVMGRNCGDIALYAGLAGGAESIIIPEIKFDVDDICQKLLRGKNRGKLHNIILLAEGVGKPYELAEQIEDKTGIGTRVSVIGYLQRGGTPSPYDRVLASQFGAKAVELLINDESCKAVGIKGNKIIAIDLDEALGITREIDRDLYKLTEILAI